MHLNYWGNNKFNLKPLVTFSIDKVNNSTKTLRGKDIFVVIYNTEEKNFLYNTKHWRKVIFYVLFQNDYPKTLGK